MSSIIYVECYLCNRNVYPVNTTHYKNKRICTFCIDNIKNTQFFYNDESCLTYIKWCHLCRKTKEDLNIYNGQDTCDECLLKINNMDKLYSA